MFFKEVKKLFAHKVVLQICIWSLNSLFLSKHLWKKKYQIMEMNTSFRKAPILPVARLKQSIPLPNWCTIVSGIEGEII